MKDTGYLVTSCEQAVPSDKRLWFWMLPIRWTEWTWRSEHIGQQLEAAVSKASLLRQETDRILLGTVVVVVVVMVSHLWPIATYSTLHVCVDSPLPPKCMLCERSVLFSVVKKCCSYWPDPDQEVNCSSAREGNIAWQRLKFVLALCLELAGIQSARLFLSLW